MAGKEFSDGRSIVEVAGRFEARTSKQEFVVGGNQKRALSKRPEVVGKNYSLEVVRDSANR